MTQPCAAWTGESKGWSLFRSHRTAYKGKGFKDVIILPKGTNADITKNPEATGEDRLLTAENKWLIAHADAKIDGAFNGLQGENISVL